MNAKWFISIGSAFMGALVTYQTLFANEVSIVATVLRLVLYAFKAVLLVAVGRPHPKITD
jgi:hypothetical protein